MGKLFPMSQRECYSTNSQTGSNFTWKIHQYWFGERFSGALALDFLFMARNKNPRRLFYGNITVYNPILHHRCCVFDRGLHRGNRVTIFREGLALNAVIKQAPFQSMGKQVQAQHRESAMQDNIDK